MTLPRPLFFLGRACFGVFIFLTSSYCLLAFVPFTYHQILLAAPLPWLSLFVRVHPYVLGGLLGVLVLTMVPDLRRRETRILALSFLLFCAGCDILLLVHPLLSGLRNETQSFYWGLASLVPLPWLAAIDWLGQRKTLSWAAPGGGEDHRIFRAAWQSAVFLSLLYSASFYLRYKGPAASESGVREGVLSLSWTVVSHLLVFMAIFVILFLLRSAARLFGQQSKIEFLFFGVFACLLGTGILRFLIFPLISFLGPLADIFALAAGTAFGAFFAGLSVKLYPAEKRAVDSGLALLLTPLRWGRLLPGGAGFLPFVIIALVAHFLAVRSAVLDWNFLRQKLSALLIWAATFANFYELAPRRERKEKTWLHTGALLFAALATLGPYEALGLWQRHDQRQTGKAKVDVAAVLEAYASYDASFKLLYDALSPVPSAPAFYRFLLANTNIPWAAPTNPVEVNLADNHTAQNSPKPNIFIFVIDSLRRDYLSPYNPAVTFTPSIDAFARESVVIENAFTQYGGTGLSEPAIWVGGMLLHKQYVTPFYPMNALQKLLEAEGYRSFISKDPILRIILHPSPSMSDLNSDIPGRKYDFCQSLEDLESKISAPNAPTAPFFAFAQAQNIHVWVLNQEGESVPPGESYPGFHAPIAARLRQMDLCFGKFHQFMKKSGLYDRSIIILTSDHGDSLGEGGRWGHGYAIFEEIIRVPLIIHLPPALRERLYVNPRAVAFLTDITPSLYYILGHKPIRRNGVFGRPLFTETPEEEAQYLRDSYLIASSYGPVYGILKNNGHSFYIVNAENYKDYLFDLPENSSAVSAPVTASIRSENEQRIRDDILGISRFYRFEQPR